MVRNACRAFALAGCLCWLVSCAEGEPADGTMDPFTDPSITPPMAGMTGTVMNPIQPGGPPVGSSQPGGAAGNPAPMGQAGAAAPGAGGATAVPPMMTGSGGATVGPGAGGAAGGVAGSTAPPMMMPPMNDGIPIIPEVAGECPMFRGGSISFGGLSGISVSAGTKQESATAPMVFYWHGTGSFSGEYASMAAAVSSGVAKEGGILISFQGTTGGDLLSGTAIFGMGDFAITDQLLACAVKNHNIDPKRVFATGCSAGGLFSGAMAAARSNYIAAAAPNSGGWTAPVKWQNGWTPALMTIHGAPGLDVVIIDFSNSSATADKAFKARGGFVINCNHGGGHCGGGGLAPDIWEFFKAHPYGTKPSPWEGGLPSGFSSQCKIYTAAPAMP